MRPAGDDAERLSDLQQKWSRHWQIWRGRRSDDIGDERTGSWIASRINPAAGPEPTVARDSAAALNEALVRQADKARRGAAQYTISEAGPE